MTDDLYLLSLFLIFEENYTNFPKNIKFTSRKTLTHEIPLTYFFNKIIIQKWNCKFLNFLLEANRFITTKLQITFQFNNKENWYMYIFLSKQNIKSQVILSTWKRDRIISKAIWGVNKRPEYKGKVNNSI